MYRVYLRTFNAQVTEKTSTPDRAAAQAAFVDLVERTELDGQKLAAVLSYQNRQLAFHRFDRAPGSADYWRDRIDEIEWPQRGGAREGAGAKTADGAAAVQRYNVTLDADSEARARHLGDGDRSLGIRRALKAAG